MKIIVASTLLFLSTMTIAMNRDCSTHTWHQITSTEGNWKVSLRYISEQGDFYDTECRSQVDTQIAPDHAYRYGTAVRPDSSFDLAYSVTIVNQDDDNAFTSATCVFIVSAKGPAIPDVVISSYNGAKCETIDKDGHGVNFIVGK